MSETVGSIKALLSADATDFKVAFSQAGKILDDFKKNTEDLKKRTMPLQEAFRGVFEGASLGVKLFYKDAGQAAEATEKLELAGRGVQQAFGAFNTIVPLVQTLGTALLPITLAFAGIVLLIGSIKKNWDGIADAFKRSGIAEYFRGIAEDLQLLSGTGLHLKKRNSDGSYSTAPVAAQEPSAVVDTFKTIGQDLRDSFAEGLGSITDLFDNFFANAKGRAGKEASKEKDATTAEYLLAHPMALVGGSDMTNGADITLTPDTVTGALPEGLPSEGAVVTAPIADEAAQHEADISAGVNNVVSAFGEAGNAVSGIVQAFQGGPIAGITAIFAQVAARSPAIQHVIGVVMNVFGDLAAALEPLFQLVEAIVLPILEALSGIFEAVGYAVQGLIDVLNAAFGWLGLDIGSTSDDIKTLGEAAKEASDAFYATAHQQAEQIRESEKTPEDRIKEAVANYEKAVIDLATVQQKQAADDARVKEMQAKLEEANRQAAANEHTQQSMQAVYMYQAALANAMAAAKADQDAASQASTGVADTETILNAALASAKNAQDALTESTARAGESMANLPAGYKVALARFNAQDAIDTGAAQSQPSQQYGGVGTASFKEQRQNLFTGAITINGLTDLKKIYEEITKQSELHAYQATGNIAAFVG